MRFCKTFLRRKNANSSFLKETLLASIEEAKLVHKVALAKPLETEEEIEEAVKNAERLNRKAERRAILRGLPPPPIYPPVEHKVVWGWLLGPNPRHQDGVQADTRPPPRRQEALPIDEESIGAYEGSDTGAGYGGYGVREAAREATPHGSSKRTPSEYSDPYPSFGSTSPQAVQADQYRTMVEAEQIALNDDEVQAESENGIRAEQDTGRREKTGFKAQLYNEVIARDDFYVDHAKWDWCANQERLYHQARFIAAQETAERQYVRRLRYREEREIEKKNAAEDREFKRVQDLAKEKRRMEAMKDVQDYAETTGEDVNGWLEELSRADVGEVATYRPTHQARGGAVPRGQHNRRRTMRPAGFPIN